ncbi:MAG TPA: tetratricopeptide repeat-containing sensor histidine kinase, partial [Cyclobacteriaceae bacterium]|nr:tetratricopeptide repeat-containing sensor histidine kinase [Cyclobacteriaceae bacterium]
AFNARGWAQRKLGNPACIPDFEFALGVAKRNGHNDQVLFLLNNLAISHDEFANYDEALDYNFQSLQLRQKSGTPKEISVALNNIGVVYSNLKDYDNALKYYVQCKDLKEANDISHDLDRAYVNIAEAYFYRGEYSLANKSIDKVFDLCRDRGCNDDVLAEARYALSKILIQKEEFNQALSELDKTIDIAQKSGSRPYEAQSFYQKAIISWKLNRPIDALKFLSESDLALQHTELRDQILDNYLLYTSIYNGIGNFQKASEYQQKYIDLNNQVFSGDLIKNISRIQTEFEERENLKTIASKNQVLKLQEDIIARQKSEYAFIITITFLVMGLALVTYRANQTQRKTNQQLAQAKETIQHQNELLSNTNQMLESEVQERTKELFQTNESLTKVNEEMDNFIYKTSHDIRGPLATLKGMCNVAMVDVKDELALTYLKKLDTSAAKLNAILSRLLIINQINHSLLNPEYIKFEDQIEEIIALEAKKGLPARMKFTYDVEPGLNFRSDKEMTRIILENLIDNAIKFYNDSQRIDPFVHVRVFSEGQNVVVNVTDNGIGIDESSKDKIFNLFVRASERSDSGGIGLYLSKLASTKLGGTIELTPTSDSTTQFTVTFPRDLLAVLEERRTEELKREKQRQNAIKKG